jgi:hypothetical protein
MAGTPIMPMSLPLSGTETAYGMVMRSLGLENATAGERLERLLTMSLDDLVAKTPMGAPLIPYVDGDIVPAVTTFKDLETGSWPAPGRQWCAELMIGDCQHDVSMLLVDGLMLILFW